MVFTFLIAAATIASSVPPAKASWNADRLHDKKGCRSQIEELAGVAASDDQTYINYARILRRHVLSNPGPNHRVHARAALAKLLLLRVKAIDPSSEDCIDTNAPLRAADARLIAPWLELADKGAPGVPELREALQGTDQTPEAVGKRMLAAYALSLSGISPDMTMITEMNKVIAAELNADVKFEEILALAAYAQRSKDAFGSLRTLLMTTKDCSYAEAAAASLPGEDLRYRLYRSLDDTADARGRKLRIWVRAKSYSGCPSKR